jgi:hypothetical protein
VNKTDEIMSEQKSCGEIGNIRSDGFSITLSKFRMIEPPTGNLMTLEIMRRQEALTDIETNKVLLEANIKSTTRPLVRRNENRNETTGNITMAFFEDADGVVLKTLALIKKHSIGFDLTINVSKSIAHVQSVFEPYHFVEDCKIVRLEPCGRFSRSDQSTDLVAEVILTY